MEVGIDKDERYPFYTMLNREDRLFKYATKVEIDAGLWVRYTRVMREFERVQKELGRALKTTLDET